MTAGPHVVQEAMVGGKRTGARDSFEVLDPSTGRPCALVARCGADQVDQAVASARHTFETIWRHQTAAVRAATCRRMAEVLRAHRRELAELETLDTGKPARQASVDVDVAARYFEFYGSTVEALFGDTLLAQPDLVAATFREPHGVCGHIIPWNYPLQVLARTVAPALAAGNCCVLKPAEDAPLTSLRVGELAVDAGFPPGALNVVPGLGEEAGAALAAHPGLDYLSFTGSREVGQLVMTAAAASIVPVTLELGGKSPHLVFADYDPATAIPLIVSSIVEHAGQNCSAGSRLLVHESVHDAVVNALSQVFASLRMGAGRTDPDLGPLISARQRDRVLSYLELGRPVARLVTGGGVPDDPGLAGGFFVQPTIFDEVPTDSHIWQEEIFGPVLSVTPFGTPEQAAALANGTSYGLSAGIWTRDLGLAHWLARELRVSQVFVNSYSAAGGVELPFGGYKRSGFGREKGFEALREYTRCKAVAIRVDSPVSAHPAGGRQG